MSREVKESRREEQVSSGLCQSYTADGVSVLDVEGKENVLGS